MRRAVLRRLGAVAVLSAVLVPFASRPAWACSCAILSKPRLAHAADAVFTGTVARITDDRSGRLVNFDVDTVYRGPVDPSIDVRTGLGGGDCGFHFVIDRRYTVFAFGSSRTLSAGICGPPVRGDIDPNAYGLGPGSRGFHRPVTGLHRPLSVWLVVFSAIAFGILVVAIVVAARRRRREGADPAA
ncbi:MAG TPA: hypothetical protein VID47_18390 [Actinomycetota bacterium]